jgi:hypothetical protein
MQPGATRDRVRCRLITEADLDAIVALLCQGFPGRSRMSWEKGLGHMRRREVPEGAPRFGYCLDADGKLVGVILLIASTRRVNGDPAVFCNVASWYVLPQFRAYAQLVVSIALRNKTTTYTNVSPSPHTWPIVENQGYTRYCNGLFFAAAALMKPKGSVVLEEFDKANHATMADFHMFHEQQELGCEVLVAREGSELTGYVFRRYRILSGRLVLPAMLAIHAPDRAQLIRLTGNFGRYFLKARGAPFLVMDADGPVAGLRGYFTAMRGRKYFKGPHRPSLCDLANSEFAIFGV